MRAVNSSPKLHVHFSMFIGLFIDSKRILETLKIVGLNPCATRIYQTLKQKISKIGLRLDCASRTGALDHSWAAINRLAIDLLLVCVNAGMLDPCLGARALVRSIVGLLRSIALAKNFSFFPILSFMPYISINTSFSSKDL